MPRLVPTFLIVIGASVVVANSALAQSEKRTPTLTERAFAGGGRVHGLVQDDVGRAVPGVSVVALGTTMASARSDGGGRFSLELQPGDYVLRATRTGYVSTYRELIRIHTSALLERNIRVVRQDVRPGGRVVFASSSEPAASRVADPPPQAGDDMADYAPSEAAWRLRHLRQSALRDVAGSTGLDDPARNSRSYEAFPSWLGLAMKGSVNFLTTGSRSAASGWLPSQFPHAVASVALGAPVGSRGDWTVRGGAMNGADLSSWVVFGEYQARERQAHVFTIGASYSTQLEVGGQATPLSATDLARSVGGLHGFDRWQIRPGLELDYGLRLDRYDYVTESQLLSPRLGARVAVSPSTHVTVLVSHRAIAPGADEFLPPPSAGPWLPPQRLFAPLVPGTPFLAERVRHYKVGLEHEFSRAATAPSIIFGRFRQSSDNQAATLFGLDEVSDSGRYYVASPGSVEVRGWTVRVTGHLAARVRGSVGYAIGSARWIAGPEADAIALLVPSVIRAGRERLHDVTTSLETIVPETSTRVLVVYRANTAFSRAGTTGGMPFAAGRFDLEVHQALPFRLVRGGKVEALFTIRNLFRDSPEWGSFYDELLTVTPPLRIMGGFQVRF